MNIVLGGKGVYIVVSYDIVDDKKRRDVSNLLLDYGMRVQKSVFECIVDEYRYIEMKQRIEEIVDMENDSVRFYYICERCKDKVEIAGRGLYVSDDDIIVF